MMMNSSFLSSASFSGHPSTNTVVVGSSAPTIHAQYRCDVCKVQPIQGIRYHCDSCTDYDMCQNCWKHRRNEHPSFHNFSTFGTAGSGSFLTNNNISSFSSNVPSSSFNTINMMNSSSSVPSSLPSNMNTSTTYTPPYQPPIPTNIPNNPSVQPLSQRVFYNQLPPSTNSQPTTFSPPKPLLNPTVTSSSPSNVKLPSGNVIPFQPSTTSGSSVNNSSSTLAHNTTHIHINHTIHVSAVTRKFQQVSFNAKHALS
ncbi:hypothetical protein C9374_001964 [Naegleria lovaniensis]|uniref:ZZ-type domain-containing protein n=1 Tax=Naegleria lovaniensis TaxID=51637 RepID=A0AA88GWB0_NAELO|nr:uncharacterized protein C9374_001964 [Naegleria lovaniensis]KAG2386929.1 hypothetical protein C9374_001964 [Naegleria lovaniensis]